MDDSATDRPDDTIRDYATAKAIFDEAGLWKAEIRPNQREGGIVGVRIIVRSKYWVRLEFMPLNFPITRWEMEDALRRMRDLFTYLQGQETWGHP